MSVAAPAFLPPSVDEDAVRRLCGATFAEADALQRAGHVLQPTFGVNGLSAGVRGVWRRVDRVTVQVRGGRLYPVCTRDVNGFCRHAGAVLLQALRDPASIVEEVAPAEDAVALGTSNRATASYGAAPVDPLAIAPVAEETETPEAELARLLEYDTVPHLREIARRRGVRAPGTKKADVVAALTAALAEPTSIDAALAALGPDERRALDAATLASGETVVRWETVSQVYRLLGGEGEPPRTAFDAGLVMPAGYSGYEGNYLVPRLVATRLPSLDRLAERAGSAPDAAATDGAAVLGIVELLQVVSLELLSGGAAKVRAAPPPESIAAPPPGLAFAGNVTPDRQTLQTDGALLVPRRFLAGRDLGRLTERTGQGPEVVDFAVRLMLSLGVAEAAPEVTVRRERLQALLDLSPAARQARLIRAWLAIAGPPEIAAALEPPGRLRLRWHSTYGYAYWVEPLQPPIASAARLVTRLLQRLPPDVWYDLSSFGATVERLATYVAPRLVHLRNLPATNQGLTFAWITDRGQEERLALRTPEAWSRVVSSLVAALLGGPLRWLGLVEAIVDPADRTGRFRAYGPGAAPHAPGAAHRPRAQAWIDEDLTVLVPAGTAEVSVHGRLARAGELVEATPAGLRYRLTPVGLHALFESGTTGPELVRFLTELAGQDLPPAVQETIEGWWNGYGTIRLYDELTVVELGDDLLQRELLAATSLAAAVVHVFSPRLLAVDPARAEELVAQLTARGYAPRVVEEG